MADPILTPISAKNRVLKDAKCGENLPYSEAFRTQEIAPLEAPAPENENPASRQATVIKEETTPRDVLRKCNPEDLEAAGISTLHSHTYKDLYKDTNKTSEKGDAEPSQEVEDNLERYLKQEVADEIENLWVEKLQMIYEAVQIAAAEAKIALDEPLRNAKPKIRRRIGSARLKDIPNENRLVWQIEALHDLAGRRGVYEVSTVLGPNVQQDILRIATEAHGRPNPLDRLT